MTTLTPYVLRYVGERQRTGDIAPNTADSIRNHLWLLDEIVGDRPLDQLGKWVVDRWLEQSTQWRASTRASRLCSIRCFAGWLVDNDIIRKDFTRGAPKIRRPRSEPRDIQIEHFLACLEHCHTTREEVVVWLEYGLGLRCVEIARLGIDDWDTAVNELHVVGKAGHERTVPVPTIVRALFASYLRERGARWGPFVHNELRPEAHLSASRVSNMTTRIIARTGMKVRPYDGFSAHGMRAGAGSDLLDVCGDPRIVQQFMGHASLATLHRYMRRVGKQKVSEALEQRRWVA